MQIIIVWALWICPARQIRDERYQTTHNETMGHLREVQYDISAVSRRWVNAYYI